MVKCGFSNFFSLNLMIYQNEDPVQKRGPLQKEIKAPL